MKADASPLLTIFEKKMRLEVPLFQRQYVWNKEHQWEPLWVDIARKFTESLDGRLDAPTHFLGAMVLDQKQTPTTHVEKRQIIDGQQRLTTLQIFLSALRDFCRDNRCDELANECEGFTLNKGMMANPNTDQFKVWPTQSDRSQFSDVVLSKSREEIERRHPSIRRKYARKPDPRPRMIEAYLFFYDQLQTYFLGSILDDPIYKDVPLETRLVQCFQALKNTLSVVVIDLDAEDDPQVIFETLNARGEPLLPADLLRNYIFLRAARAGESPEALYEQYWKRFDDKFWRHEIRQGRLLRPRSDLFVQHFLASRQTVDIPIKHLFVEYKFWIERASPFPTIRDELSTIARQGDDFRRFLEAKESDVVFPLVTFLDKFDIGTVYPLLLYLCESGISESAWKEYSTILESYLLRRSICGLSTQGYNRIFLALTKSLQKDGPSPINALRYLSSMQGESSEWPTFSEAWRSIHVYHVLNHSRVIHVLQRLNETFLEPKMEEITIHTPLTIEHIMPQNWIKHWPLPDGSKGIPYEDLWKTSEDDLQAIQSRKRNSYLHTFGNLTILTKPLNSSVSKGSWEKKKPEIVKSLLPINRQLIDAERWDESTIERRTKQLLNRALKLWPRPETG